jgi:uncharacterized protein (DUF885 family)
MLAKMKPKSFLKWTAAGLGTVVAIVVALAVHTWYFRPLSIDIFFERVFVQFLLREPEILSQVGVLHQMGYRGLDDELADLSPRHAEDLARLIRRDLEQLHGYDRAALSESQQLSYDVLDWYLRDLADGERWLYHDYPVNHVFGEPNATLEFMVRIHPLDDAEDARNYVARLTAIPKKFAGLTEGLRARESKGVIAPGFVIDRVLEQIRTFLATPPEQSVLFTHLSQKTAQLRSVSPDEREFLLSSARDAIASEVYPAFQHLSDFLVHQREKAHAEYGVGALPQGEAYYDYLIRHHTTTLLTARQVHELGLAEVARVEQEMDGLLRDRGLREGTVGARMAQLSGDPSVRYTNDDAGREQCLADYQRVMDEMIGMLPRAFASVPNLPVRVARMPSFNESGATAAYADFGSLDGSRPPAFFVNLRDMSAQPKFSVRTLTYHEGVPGHLLQGAFAASLTGVPTFRKVVPFTAYAEGWALYSERLAWELGLENDPIDNLGRLQMEMLRAARLVVDSGIHHEHWSRDRAIEYLIEKTGRPRDDVVSEVERYFVMPGQALAYLVGMQKILDLRAAARERLGEKFDLREFHRAVLSDGALPLSTLEARTNAWVEKAKPPDDR